MARPGRKRPDDRVVRFRSLLLDSGFTQLPNALLDAQQRLGLSNASIVLWCRLARYARDTLACWPGQGQLGAEAGLSDRQLRRVLVELQRHGLLHVQQRGRGRSNLYVLDLPATLAEPSTARTDMTGQPSTARTDMTGPDRTFMTGPNEVDAIEVDTAPADQRRPRGREQNALWDALAFALGSGPQTRTEQQVFGKVVRELREADASPEQVGQRVRVYVERYGRDKLTAPAIAKHWSSLNGHAASRPVRQATVPCSAEGCDSGLVWSDVESAAAPCKICGGAGVLPAGTGGVQQ